MNTADTLYVLMIALGLAADCFAVSLSIGASGRGVSRKRVLRVALSFGIFQMLMPILGWLAGQTIVQFIAQYDHWVAFALLSFVGIRMIIEFFRGEGGSELGDIGNWVTVITLAIATSIDALAVGMTFAVLNINIWLASAVIGSTAFLITLLGFWLGRRVGTWLGKWSLLFGAVILIGIGLRILLTHWSA
jgi:putative Mn2+ efflux pump MntP